MKLTFTMFAVLGFGVLAQAQPAQSTITVDSPDLACSTSAGAHMFTVQSWSFSATNATTGVPIAGKVQISSLTINKAFDECSASIFAAVTAGRRLTKLVVTQSDATGKVKEMTVTLGEVFVSNYALGGAPNSAQPVESIGFSFSQITIVNLRNNSQAGWDVRTNRAL